MRLIPGKGRISSPFGAPVALGAPATGGVPEVAIGGTPPAQGESTAYWTSPLTPLVYGTPNPDYGTISTDPAVTSQAVWQTPLFDLRSDFRARSGYSGKTQAIGREILLGINYALQLQLQGVAALAPFIRCYYMEFMAAENPNTARFSMDPVDITLQVSQGYTTTVTGQTPPGQTWLEFVPSGKPRYWGVTLIINYRATAGSSPIPFAAAGAMH